MGVLEDAIREHLDLKRKHGASDAELNQQESEALGPTRRDAPESEPADAAEAPVEPAPEVVEPVVEAPVEPPPVEPAPVEEPAAEGDDDDPDFGGEASEHKPSQRDLDFD
jgi:hypothetical protein